MAGPWLVLVGTKAAFFDVGSIVAQVERLPGRWHTQEPPEPLPSEVNFHFWYMPTAAPASLVAISERRRVDGVIVAPELLPRGVKARVKVRIGAGTNNVELGNGEVCLNTPGINADATAEWTFRALLWAYGGASPEAIAERTAGGALHSASEAFGALYNHELTHRHVALLGGGNITQEVVRLCRARHMRVRLWSSGGAEGAMGGVELVSARLDEVLRDADVVSVHVPLVTEGARATDGLLDEAHLRLLKRGAVLLNLARPQLVRPDALLRLMLDGHIAKAVIDGDLFRGADGESGPLLPFVRMAREHQGELAGRLLALPHVGGDTSEEARVRGMAQAVRQVHAALAGERLVNLVRPVPPPLVLPCRDAPQAELPAHIGAVSLAAVRRTLGGQEGERARQALRDVAALTDAQSDLGAMDDATLRRLLKSLRVLAEQLPLDRRLES